MTADHGTQQSFLWTFTKLRHLLQDNELIVRAESEDAHGYMEVERRDGSALRLYAFYFKRNGDTWMSIECPGLFKFEALAYNVNTLRSFADLIWVHMDLVSHKPQKEHA